MAVQPLFGTMILSLTAISAGAGFVLAAYGVSRSSTAAKAYALVSGIAAFWSLAYLVQLSSTDPTLVRAVYPFVIAFAVLSPFAWFIFCLVWTDRAHWLTHPLVLLVLIEPFVFIVLFLAGVAPNVVDPTIQATSFAGLTLIEVTSAPGDTFQILFIYAVITVATALLVHALRETRSIYRRQTALILIGSLIVFGSNIVWYVGLTPHPALDLTPVLSAANAIVAGYAIFGYGALRQLPVTASAIIDALADPVVVVDPDGLITDCNDVATTALPDVETGAHIDDVLPGVKHAAAEGVSYSIPGEPTRSIFDVHATPTIGSAGGTLAYTYHFQDVTHRVHREETLSALHIASRRLTTAESRETVAEVARDALVDALSFDLAGVMLYDAETERLEPTAVTDTLAAFLDGPMRINPNESFIWNVYSSGEPYIGPLDDEQMRQLPDTDLSMVAVIPLGEHGILGAGAVSDDHESLQDDRFLELLAATTQASLDRAERESELREQRREIAAQHERIEFFNSLLRHDLLNGLMIVRGHIDLLTEQFASGDGVDVDSARTQLGVVDRWTEDMAGLIQRIRSVIDTLSGGAAPTRSAVGLASLLQEKIEKLDASYESATVSVDIDDVTIHADPLIGDVIGNVLFNAVEHHDRETQHLHVSTSVTDNTVTIRIADDGPGIPDETKQEVFAKDYTTRGTGTLGFGLYFVAVTVERYGGSVHIEDNDPRGSVAVIELPRAGDTVAADESVDSVGESVDSVGESVDSVGESVDSAVDGRPDPTDS